MTSPLVIYTDGACLGNPDGWGGWAFVAYDGTGQVILEDSGSEAETTNNRMELLGAIGAAEFSVIAMGYQPANPGFRLSIVTDSQYVQKGITEWLPGWVRKGWMTSKGPVKNKDLWERLHAINSMLNIEWLWVRGHSGDVGNERADTLASEAALECKRTNPKASASKSQISKKQTPKNQGARKHAQSSQPKADPTSEKVYLVVPFAEKDAAKQAGARWDAAAKQWYAPHKVTPALSKWTKK